MTAESDNYIDGAQICGDNYTDGAQNFVQALHARVLAGTEPAARALAACACDAAGPGANQC